MSGNEYEITDYKSAFEYFKKRFLVDKKSIFRETDEIIVSMENIDFLIEKFINNAYVGNATSQEKFCHQLTGFHLDEVKNRGTLENIQKYSIEILATAIWLWRLPASNSNNESRKNSTFEILSFASISIDNMCLFNDTKDYTGFALPGMGYNINKANELAYIIRFFKYCLENKEISIDSDAKETNSWINYLKKESTVEIKETVEYSVIIEKNGNNKIRKYSEPKKLSHKNEKNCKVSINNPLLHLFSPEDYEPIISSKHKEYIFNTFITLNKFSDCKVDGDIDASIKRIKAELRNYNKEYHFYQTNIKNIWFGGLDFESKNLILHGAPGTGKTYLTEETIKARKDILGNIEYELVQFHPNYGYEDFIDGIKPVGLEQGQMKFELKNGIFKQMCIDAFKNLEESKNDPSKLKTYYFIADEINRAELSRVFGELLLCLEDDKRLRFDKDGILLGTKIKTQNSNLWEDKHAVVIEENNKKEFYFGVPENIYFIGTMNDIDRSVDSFDMALRRRFTWKHIRCDYDVIVDKYQNDKNIDKYIEICKNLNKHILEVFNLSNSYELGQSYFMKPNKLTQKELYRVWIEHIAPILKEYLRAEYSEKEIESKLKEAQIIYKFENDTNS